MRTAILIFTFLLFGQLAKSSWVLGVDFYSNQIGVKTYEIHLEFYTIDYPVSSTIINPELTDTLLMPDTSYLVGFNTYRTDFIYIHTYASFGDYMVSYYEPNWHVDIVNIFTSISQVVTDSISIKCLPFLANNQFGGFVNNPLSGSLIGSDFNHDLSVIETDGDSVTVEQVVVSDLDYTIYTFPSATSFASSENLSGFTYQCNGISSLPYKLAVSFDIHEYKLGVIVATHNRALTFQYGTIGIDELKNESAFSINPNPVSSQIIISSFENNAFDLLNYLGKKITTLNSNVQTDITFLESGIYFITDKNGISKKFVKL